ncbi:MAG: hypothetical protein M5R36_28020 [Deltaproteobacteria bacterium]|nr:hypothetical protein [Deltaproteobacteria bacterium]
MRFAAKAFEKGVAAAVALHHGRVRDASFEHVERGAHVLVRRE